ncbi:hypothetical protein DSO57_1002139 [Entomophthora muscae]|uniref:Uncharacterized protein n=2 Tax=Entomophthora muscae TaxID=34485 RepID=A0ACC2SAF0_9FUNG|nr:hypothetical protein DSO57_1004253 [Entomophthora muscae]KAJ9063233.1 hypothetical protein DSO57_1002139 [Entomophthora muscae]
MQFNPSILLLIGAASAASAYYGVLQCPDPRIELCKMMNSLDDKGNRNLCTGMACPPCWAFHDGAWECTEKTKGKCTDKSAIDILNYPYGCYSRAAQPALLDISSLNK